MEINYLICFATALIPLIVGSIWYNPKVFGSVWMRASGVTEAQIQSGNMAFIFGLVYILGILLSFFFTSFAIHQSAVDGLFLTQPGIVDGSDQVMINFVETFHATYGDLHRSFGHGAVHGGLAAVVVALPVIAINALFERRGGKYIGVHFGYWFITFILMGGAVCELA